MRRIAAVLDPPHSVHPPHANKTGWNLGRRVRCWVATMSRTTFSIPIPEVAKPARNLVWGLGWGLGVAAGFSMFALLVVAFRGGDELQRNGTTPASLLAAYCGAGLVGGVLLGLTRPLLRWRAAAIVLGPLRRFGLRRRRAGDVGLESGHGRECDHPGALGGDSLRQLDLDAERRTDAPSSRVLRALPQGHPPRAVAPLINGC